MKNEFLTDKQKEKIYFTNEELEMVKNSTIVELFNEIIKRRRNIDIEDGLQASIVIFPDELAAKIAEADGTAPHIETECNLVRFIKGKNTFFKTGCPLNQFTNDMLTLLAEGLTIQLLASRKKLRLAIDSRVDFSSIFQISMLQKIILLCQEIDNKTYFDSIEIGLYISSCYIECQELTDEHFDKIMISLRKAKEQLIQDEEKRMSN